MSPTYQPLHHKYRPQNFDSLVGQDAIAATLNQALKTSRIAPAYLFSGPRGTGKTSSARILARSLNCLSYKSPTTEPCGECDLCKSITNGSALDVIEIDAASNTGVDNIRELIERSRFVPVQARWKVYVIDECHMLSTAAFNALLKTLEEPPEKVVFVLATTDPQRVLPTILSRCQRFDFRRIALQSIKNHLQMIAKEESISIEAEAIEIIAQRAQGGLRDAESLLDQLSLLPGTIKAESVFELIGAVPEEELIKLISALIQEEPIILLEACRTLLNRGREPIALLEGLASILRDLLITKVAPEQPKLLSISEHFRENVKTLAEIVSQERILEWQANLKGSESQMRNSIQPYLWIEILLLGLLAKSPLNHNIQEKKVLEDSSELNNKVTLSTKPKTEQISKSNEKHTAQLIATTSESLNSDPVMKETNSISTNLSELWQQILGSLELPSTRMLLSQQAKLVHIDNKRAVVEVSGNWVGMVQSRSVLLEKAIKSATGSEKKLIIEQQNNQTIVNNVKNIEGAARIVTTPPQAIANKEVQVGLSEKNKEPTNKVENNAKNLAEFFNVEVVEESENEK